MEFQLEELNEAQLQEEEEEALDNERHLLGNAETLFESANQLYEQLYGGDLSETSTLDGLKSAGRAISRLGELDGSLAELKTRFESALYELEDHRLSDSRLPRQGRVQPAPPCRGRGASRPHPPAQAQVTGVRSLRFCLTRRRPRRNLESLQVGSDRIEELKDQVRIATRQAGELATENSRGNGGRPRPGSSP